MAIKPNYVWGIDKVACENSRLIFSSLRRRWGRFAMGNVYELATKISIVT